MPSNCSVKFCKVRSVGLKHKNISFYHFPHNEKLQAAWIKACGKDPSEVNLKHARICSTHFLPNSFKDKSCIGNTYYSTKNPRRLLREDVVPTENLYWKNPADIPEEMRIIKSKKKVVKDKPAINRNNLGLLTIHPENSYLDMESDESITEELEDIDLDAAGVRIIEAAVDGSNIIYLPSSYVTENGASKQQIIATPGLENCSHNHQNHLNNDITEQQSKQKNKELKRKIQLTRPTILPKRKIKVSEPKTAVQPLRHKTDPEILTLRRHLRIMTAKYEMEKEKLKNIRRETINHAKKVLSRIFSPTQIDMLLNPRKAKAPWTDEEINRAVRLRKMSPKVYHHLIHVMKLPLPSVTAINRHILLSKKIADNNTEEVETNETEIEQNEKSTDAESIENEKEIQSIPKENSVDIETVLEDTIESPILEQEETDNNVSVAEDENVIQFLQEGDEIEFIIES